MHHKLLTRALAIVLIALLSRANLFAYDSASFELAIAVPSPVTAGDIVSFQGIAVNKGTENWLRGNYYWEAEIYDGQKKYISKTERLKGAVNVGPGETSAANLSFSVPQNFGGPYYFRLFIIHRDIRIAQSQYIAFQVVQKPLPVTPTTKVSALSGSAILAYQNADAKQTRDGQASSIFNIVGNAGGGTYLLNSNNIHDSTSAWKPYIVLGSYNTAAGSVNLGDVSPTLSPLTLGGQGMRGVEMVARTKVESIKLADWSLVGGRTIEGQTGDANTNGRYQRLVYAGRATFALLDEKVKIAPSLLFGVDNKSSLSSNPRSSKFRGPTLVPQGNQVGGLSVSVTPKTNLELSLDLAQSKFTQDMENPQPTGGSALQFQATVNLPKLDLRGSVLRASPQFNSFGATSISPDRLNYGLQSTYKPLSWANANVSFNQSLDNLAKDSKKTTSVQRQYALSPTFLLPTQTTLSTGWSLNTTQGNPRANLDNLSQTYNLGASQLWRSQSVSANFQNSLFKDKNKTAHDLGTNTLALSANLVIRKDFRLSLGNTLSTTKDKVDGHSRNSSAQSLSVNFTLIPKQLMAQSWGTSSIAKDNGATSAANNRSWSLNTELSWQVKDKLVLTGGVSQANERDVILDKRATKTGVSVRTSLNF